MPLRSVWLQTQHGPQAPTRSQTLGFCLAVGGNRPQTLTKTPAPVKPWTQMWFICSLGLDVTMAPGGRTGHPEQNDPSSNMVFGHQYGPRWWPRKAFLILRRFLIHSEFIFIWGKRYGHNFILLWVGIQFYQHHLLKKKYFFSTPCFDTFVKKKIGGHSFVGFFLVPPFCSIALSVFVPAPGCFYRCNSVI